jgi:hypothetical protein
VRITEITEAAFKKGEPKRAVTAGSLATRVDAIALDVPVAIFGPPLEGEEPIATALAQLRRLLFDAAGHAGGGPLWLQDDEGSDGFVLQFTEQFIDINLGDNGTMYVFEGCAFFQCY